MRVNLLKRINKVTLFCNDDAKKIKMLLNSIEKAVASIMQLPCLFR